MILLCMKKMEIFLVYIWKFDNFFRNQNLPAMIGGSKSNHKNINDGLSVPLGLAMLNKNANTDSYQDIHNRNTENRNLEGGVIKESLYSKLLVYQILEIKKKSKSKTRKKR